MKKDKLTHKEEFDEIKVLLQRTQADFINYRRRTDEDHSNFLKMAHADLIEQILPILDNFSRAAKHVPPELENDNWATGVQAIEKQLEQVLETNGLEKIKTVGEEYDHNVHEALGEVKNKKKKNNEIIAEELAGYNLNGKLLRPAKVIVNRVEKRKGENK